VENFFWQKVTGKSSKSCHYRAVKGKIRGIFLTNSFKILAPLLQGQNVENENFNSEAKFT